MNSAAIVKWLIDDLCQFIYACFEDSRERSLALTKLEECKMWLERANIK